MLISDASWVPPIHWPPVPDPLQKSWAKAGDAIIMAAIQVRGIFIGSAPLLVAVSTNLTVIELVWPVRSIKKAAPKRVRPFKSFNALQRFSPDEL